MDWKNSRLLRIAVGAAVFGALMGAKDSFSGAWTRVLVAALAGGVLGLLIAGGMGARGRRTASTAAERDPGRAP